MRIPLPCIIEIAVDVLRMAFKKRRILTHPPNWSFDFLSPRTGKMLQKVSCEQAIAEDRPVYRVHRSK